MNVSVVPSVLSELGEINGWHKEAGGMLALAMLKASDIPPIQVEATFLYNPTRKKRKTGRDIYQDKMTSAIVSGINSRFATNFTLPHFRFVRNL